MKKAVLNKSLFPKQLQEGWTYLPSADGSDENLLILLHGLGDTPENFVKLAKRMALPSTASLALAGPYELEMETREGRCWSRLYDDAWQELPVEAQWESTIATRELLFKLVSMLSDRGGWTHDRIHLFGFSQGGSTALDLALHSPEQNFGGCISISGALPLVTDSRKPLKAKMETPVLITHGEHDDVVSKEAMLQTMAILTSAGCQAKMQRIPGKGHSMISGEYEMRCLMQFWANTLKSAIPKAGKGETILEVQRV